MIKSLKVFLKAQRKSGLAELTLKGSGSHSPGEHHLKGLGDVCRRKITSGDWKEHSEIGGGVIFNEGVRHENKPVG